MLLQAAPVLLVGLMYAVRVRRLARRGRPVAAAKQAWFYGGLAVLLVAVASPLHELGEKRLLYAHMAQHLLLGDIAALAIVLGLDGAILRPLLAFPPVARLRFLAHPAVALPLWVVNLYVWHLPALYEGALAHDALHALQHQLFFLTGVLMWAAVVEPLPGPAWFGAGLKAAYVLVVRAAGAGLANIFIWSGHAFYSSYAPGERAEGITPLADQTIGGSLMLIEGGVVTLLTFGWLFLRWIREAELRQGLLDAGATPAAATRAARYATRAGSPRSLRSD
jgi:cytochrome c oxidase assembly factor CtaG